MFLKRAQVYNAGRLYMHALYRRRDALDDQLLEDLIEMSLSQYTRVRRHAQAVLQNACGVSSTCRIPSPFREYSLDFSTSSGPRDSRSRTSSGYSRRMPIQTA